MNVSGSCGNKWVCDQHVCGFRANMVRACFLRKWVVATMKVFISLLKYNFQNIFFQTHKITLWFWKLSPRFPTNSYIHNTYLICTTWHLTMVTPLWRGNTLLPGGVHSNKNSKKNQANCYQYPFLVPAYGWPQLDQSPVLIDQKYLPAVLKLLLFLAFMPDSNSSNPNPQYSTKIYPLKNNAWSICYIILSLTKIHQPYLHTSSSIYGLEEDSCQDVVLFEICVGKQQQ